MKVLILGATGMVGSEVLEYCLNHDPLRSILSIGRNFTGIKHKKLKEIKHDNFLEFLSLEEELAEADICFYCLGAYQSHVSKEKFLEITVDYQNALLDVLERVNREITFCLFSAQGADPEEKKPFLFSKVKGRAEKNLLDSILHKKYIFRPGFINPGQKKPAFMISMWLFMPIYKLLPFIGVDAPDLAKVMVHVGLEGNKLDILENRDIRKKLKRINCGG